MQNQFRGHKILYRQVYPVIYMPSHHKAGKNGIVDIHYIIAEEQLGRPLSPKEEVHHKDKNRQNYEPENLMVFDSRQSHITYHMCMRHNLDIVLTCTNNIYHCEAKHRCDKYISCDQSVEHDPQNTP